MAVPAGPKSEMVLGVCGRVLRDSHAFQAAFLVFARKAGTIGRRESVGGCWIRSLTASPSGRGRGPNGIRGSNCSATCRATSPQMISLWNDLRPVLDEEIGRLPEKYRVPFVLYYLEGQTNEEAAEQIGCPKGTVLSRLARGRERLRLRLNRRGVSLPVAALLTVLTENALSAVVPASIVSSTVQAAIPFATGRAAGGLVPAPVAALTDGVLHAMFATKLKLAAATCALAVAALGAGAAAFAWSPPSGRQKPVTFSSTPVDVPHVRGDVKQPPGEPKQPPASGPAGPRNQKQPDFQGYVRGVSLDGKTLTIEIATLDLTAKPMKTDVKIGEKTAVVYDEVATNGANPTDDYIVSVWLDPAPKGVAARTDFWGPEAANRGLGMPGTVVGVDSDGKGFALRWTD